jgi:hypothetical protein
MVASRRICVEFEKNTIAIRFWPRMNRNLLALSPVILLCLSVLKPKGFRVLLSIYLWLANTLTRQQCNLVEPQQT